MENKKQRSKFAPSIKKQELSQYLGKAGEHLVLAQLLLRKFDAALVEVDTGTDILAESKNKIIRVQVKARSLGLDNRSSIVLSEKALNRKLQPHFYILVLRSPNKEINYFIFPAKAIRGFIKKGKFSYKKNQKRYDGTVIKKEEQWFLQNLHTNITEYLNAWHLID